MPPKKKKTSRSKEATTALVEGEVLKAEGKQSLGDVLTVLPPLEFVRRIQSARDWKLSPIKATTDPLTQILPKTLGSLLDEWKFYAPRLATSINRLRDDKLLKYAKLTIDYRRNLDESNTRTKVWRGVFEERYGLSGDPEQAASTFVDNVVEKLVPEDLENIKTYIRYRSVFLALYYDAINRGSVALKDKAVEKLKPAEKLGDEQESNVRAIRMAQSKAIKRRKVAGRASIYPRIGGITLTGADKKWYEDMIKRNPVQKYCNACWDRDTPEKAAACYFGENQLLRADYERELRKQEEMEAELTKLKNRRDVVVGETEQPWVTGAWKIEPLQEAIEQVGGPGDERNNDPTKPKSLYAVLYDLVRGPRPMIGRAEILNSMAGLVHTFAFNHRAFMNQFLNWAMLGPPGTGKTTIARAVGTIFQRLGMLLTDKFTIISREDLVAGFLGQTAIKTKGVLIDHLEGTLFLDEAYQLGSDDYGLEAATAIVNFLDKFIGSIVMFAAGYEKDMDQGFFGANAGLDRRFKRWYLSAYSDVQLLQIFYGMMSEKWGDYDEKRAWSDPNIWSYLLQAFKLLNAGCLAPGSYCFIEFGGGDMLTLSGVATEYYNTLIAPERRKVTVCDMQRIIQQFVFQQQRANVLITSPDIKCATETLNPDARVVVPLTRPNSKLFGPGFIQYQESFNSTPSGSRRKAKAGGHAHPISWPRYRRLMFYRLPPRFPIHPHPLSHRMILNYPKRNGI